MKNSKSTSNISRIKKPSCLDEESQTSDFVNISDIVSEYEEKLKDLQILHEDNEMKLKEKLYNLSSEKDDVNR